MGRPKMTDAEKAAAKAKREAGKAPKKPKAAKAPQPARQAASSQSSGVEFKKPAPEELLKLIKQVCSRAADQKAKGMEAKELIDKAAETRGLNKKAFGMARMLWKMGQDAPEKLAITLPHLLAYIDDLNLAGLADEARGLPINGENDSGDDEGQTDIEGTIAETAETTGAETSGEQWPDDQQVVTRSRLSIVPGPNAPTSEDDKSDAA